MAPQSQTLGAPETRRGNAPWIVCHAYEGSACIYKEEQALPSAYTEERDKKMPRRLDRRGYDLIQYPPTYDSVGVQIKVTGKKTPRSARLLDTGTYSASWGKDVFVAEGQTQKFIVISAGEAPRLFVAREKEGAVYPLRFQKTKKDGEGIGLTGEAGIWYTMRRQDIERRFTKEK